MQANGGSHRIPITR